MPDRIFLNEANKIAHIRVVDAKGDGVRISITHPTYSSKLEISHIEATILRELLANIVYPEYKDKDAIVTESAPYYHSKTEIGTVKLHYNAKDGQHAPIAISFCGSNDIYPIKKTHSKNIVMIRNEEWTTKSHDDGSIDYTKRKSTFCANYRQPFPQ
jgi:hypothetical protein